MPIDSSISRRRVMRAAAFTAAAAILDSIPVSGGASTRPTTGPSIDPAKTGQLRMSLKELSTRGKPDVLEGDDLKYIGMPVGGIGAGQVYLGGNGSLWLWQIARDIYSSGPDGAHFAKPMEAVSPLTQRFEISINDEVSKPLTGFRNITFRGTYPIGTVVYSDPDSPVSVKLEAFSPFIPLNADESSFPATVMRFEVTNQTEHDHHFRLSGLLDDFRGAKLIKYRDDHSLRIEMGGVSDSREMGPGTMSLGLLDPGPDDEAGEASGLIDAGTVTGRVTHWGNLRQQETVVATFVVAWHYPRFFAWGPLHSGSAEAPVEGNRFYDRRFSSAADVVDSIATQFDRLYSATKLWRDTWYDSTLPYWFLDRTFIPVSALATNTFLRVRDGSARGFNSVGIGPGTRMDVWGYEQSLGRLFPELDRSSHEETPPVVQIGRPARGGPAPVQPGKAVDGMAMSILRSLRCHKTSKDRTFLTRNWDSIKLAVGSVMNLASGEAGIPTGPQPNTFGSAWYGPVAWLGALYVAALRAGSEMGTVMGDATFVKKCDALADSAGGWIVDHLYNGSFFINRPDPKHREAVNSGTGCEIDQLLGQSWAHQVGLPRIAPVKETRRALKSMFDRNFFTDVGPYRAVHTSGRCLAEAGDGGLVTCTFPDPDWQYEQAKGNGPDAAGFFNECITGMEHQAAGHMIREGMVAEGLSIERAIHDRYSPQRRNPYNEIEDGDHSARSMAAFGVYLSASGFSYDGPAGSIGFSPKIGPELFTGSFVAAEGWGTFRQTIADKKLTAEIEVKHGSLSIAQVSLDFAGGKVEVTRGDTRVEARTVRDGETVTVRFEDRLTIGTEGPLRIVLS